MPSPGRLSGTLDAPLTHRHVAAIALPITLSNATTPLVGFADTVIVGRLGDAALIGGVAVAANIFNILYWTFGFLRMGTTGLTAQAAGARDTPEVAANLYRPVLIALAAGLAMILAQVLIAGLALRLMGPSDAVSAAARQYFDIRVWAAPAGLVNFALIGWFIGLGRAGVAFWLQLLLNIVNFALAVLLVTGFGLGVTGVAIAALVAEGCAAAAGLAIAVLEQRRRDAFCDLARVLDRAALARAFAVNRDIMIRTVCVLSAFSLFLAQSARADDVTLAANAVLHSIAMVTVYLLDGFAFSAETLVGHGIGARRRDRFDEAIRLSTLWAGAVGIGLSAAVIIGGDALLAAMTTNSAVRSAAAQFLVWAALTPIVGVWCFQLDGIFIGATRTRDMRDMMLVSFLGYLAAVAILAPALGNHGLWAALIVFYVLRALTLAPRIPALRRDAFAGNPGVATDAVTR